MIWLLLVLAAILMWSSTSLLYKAGIPKDREEHLCLKYSVSVGIVFFIIAFAYLLIRDEPFTIWESAIRFWPMTVFGVVYAIINTISFNGYLYNEAVVESPVEGISGGISVILLIVVYIALGRVDSIAEFLTPLRTAGIFVIAVSVVLLAIERNKVNRKDQRYKDAKWMHRGLGTLIFPVIFAVCDGLETIVTGVCLDSTYGYAMPEGDGIIIIGMEYAIFALAFMIYICLKEKKVYNPFTKQHAPRIIGALTDNVGIVFYSYAMAINSVSTDPLLAVYPVVAMIGGRVLMKEKLPKSQYAYLLGIVTGSVLVVVDTVA